MHSSFAVSNKGWTDSEIGVAWLGNFDEQMRDKNKDEPCLLLLDGHNLHYMLNFMKYAASVNIIVLCYPAHCTHVLQGLNVVAFSGFKKIWTQCCDQWISDNPFVTFAKIVWLIVWTAAFVEAMKESVLRLDCA